MVFVDGEIKAQFFVQFVAADQTEVIATTVKKHLMEKIFGVFDNGRLAGADLVIKFEEGFIGGFTGVFEKGGFNILVVGVGIDIFEDISDFVIVFVTEGAEQGGRGNFSMAVDPHRNMVVAADDKFQPRSAEEGADFGGVEETTGVGVKFVGKKNARGTDELVDDDALDAVDDESADGGHQGNIAQKDFLFLDGLGLEIGEFGGDFEGGFEVNSLFHRLFGRKFRLAQVMVGELELKKLAGKIFNRI